MTPFPELDSGTLPPILRSGSVKLIAAAVGCCFGFTWEEMAGPSRSKTLAWARQLVYWIARHDAGRGPSVIGRALNRDHSTVVHGQAVVERRRRESPTIKAEIEKLRAVCRGAGHVRV